MLRRAKFVLDRPNEREVIRLEAVSNVGAQAHGSTQKGAQDVEHSEPDLHGLFQLTTNGAQAHDERREGGECRRQSAVAFALRSRDSPRHYIIISGEGHGGVPHVVALARDGYLELQHSVRALS